jgi:hypothetical protein
VPCNHATPVIPLLSPDGPAFGQLPWQLQVEPDDVDAVMVPTELLVVARFFDGVTLTWSKPLDFRRFRRGLGKLVEEVRTGDRATLVLFSEGRFPT